jgi:hypothetical protein
VLREPCQIAPSHVATEMPEGVYPDLGGVSRARRAHWVSWKNTYAVWREPVVVMLAGGLQGLRSGARVRRSRQDD